MLTILASSHQPRPQSPDHAEHQYLTMLPLSPALGPLMEQEFFDYPNLNPFQSDQGPRPFDTGTHHEPRDV
jgi:hypothetical protein